MQKDIFLSSEADQWFKRNIESLKDKLAIDDYLYQNIKKLDAKGKVLEVGASIGYRLGWLKSDGYQVVGIEPSKEAVNYGIANSDLTELELLVGDASTFLDKCVSKFDMIIFGHSLYLMDPEDLPNIVANTMRLLNEDGYIVIFDFDSDPQKNPYHHRENLYSYKMEFDTLFTWNPCFKLISKKIMQHDGSTSVGNKHEDCALSIIKRVDLKHAYPTLA
ncbi:MULTISPECIES: class I SAM-dependent methyltransferase [Vibrio]|uniref:class I SAM-dependent methyltransferase n=1 Tax=Vibrio TaxID=662 RepID=UPI0001B94EC8|nr:MULTISPECIES: class I SAM-dependent methyltransferase [Vibrio]EEX30738.1 methylase involved in ubiquinone/menaquinone biosynthesis [Vibrio coralliilyticus ATCC BAA-450]MCM5509481.1 class I SAM-dependent methyltransferase [Vibrio sp. SCSIO 43169]MDE3899608.1 class I SAM-dependent methyltransferase [Vibrio sp. CC007]QFT34983.1 Methyltransferase domain protein [Vibrio sp. THAF64]QGM32882.1 Methyltransferase domain protein [Vibrio sp. THAF191d]